MPRHRRILDTSLLIAHWRRSGGSPPADKTPQDARGWAEVLIELRDTDAIVTPVRIEFLAGARDAHEVALSRAFLEPFKVVDERRILERDWQEAERLACRVPSQRKMHRGVPESRDLGDCLIRAIARRLNHDVDTLDHGFLR